MNRYLRVYRKQLIALVILIVLVVISSRTRGTLAKTTAIAAGVIMVVAAISLVIWIIKTPVKKDNNQIT